MTSESPDTTDRLAEIRGRLDAVVPAGPWEVFDNGGTTNIVGEGGDPYVAHIGNSTWPNTEDVAAFVANSPADIAHLLKRVRVLEKAFGHAKESRSKYERRVIEWREAAESAAKERDAYKRAKQENDERFMTERDEAREEVLRLRARLDTAEAGLRELASLQDRIPDDQNGDWGLGWDCGYNAAFADVRLIAASTVARLGGEGSR